MPTRSERRGVSVSPRTCGQLPGGYKPGLGARMSFKDQSGGGGGVLQRGGSSTSQDLFGKHGTEERRSE